MSYPFEALHGLVLVDVTVTGPAARTAALMALDPGATTTIVSQAILLTLGYDPAQALRWVQVTTGSGLVYVPLLSMTQVRALGQERTNFPVLAHTLPPGAMVDGVLGLDFFRGQTLTIDFRNGLITLS
jgi:hypothetical protein